MTIIFHRPQRRQPGAYATDTTNNDTNDQPIEIQGYSYATEENTKAFDRLWTKVRYIWFNEYNNFTKTPDNLILQLILSQKGSNPTD